MKNSLLILIFFSSLCVNVKTQLKVDNLGRIGINNSAPAHQLDIISGNPHWQLHLQCEDKSSGTYDWFVGVSGDGWNTAANSFMISRDIASHNSKFTILENGYIGIDNNAPGSKFQINHSGTLGARYNVSKAFLRITDGSNSMLFDPNELYTSNDLCIGVATNIYFRKVTSTTSKNLARIYDGTYKLYVYGSAYASGGTWVASDINFKENIQTIPNALNLVNKLSGKTYNYKSTKTTQQMNFNSGLNYGLIAQEVETVVPELVKKTDSLGYAVNYDGMIPILIEAIKEQQNQIEDLKQQVYRLENISYNNLYPNPVGKTANLDFSIPSTTQHATLNIYNTEGKLIKQIKIEDRGNTTIVFDASNLSAGIYTYTLIADGNIVASSKIIKE